jgi:mannose-6-phosphate isomerase-like protein (cupin superfamily)
VEVNAGARLSAHRHKGRNEHWIVIEGSAEATFGDQTSQLCSGQSVYIPAGVAHRLTNPGSIPLVLVEVQTGNLLDEDDIVRLADDYGRIGRDVIETSPPGETGRGPVFSG